MTELAVEKSEPWEGSRLSFDFFLQGIRMEVSMWQK